MDIADPASVEAALDVYRPWAVVNAAGYVGADDPHPERDAYFRTNAIGAEVVAGACARRSLPLATFSSDQVFDGRLGRPYVEGDPVSPASIYGESKAEAERRVAQVHPDALVVRAGAFFGPWDRQNFIYRALRDMAGGQPLSGASQDVVSPSYVPDLAHAVLDLLVDGESGLWHLANNGATSWLDLAGWVAEQAGLSWMHRPGPDEPVARVTALSSERGLTLPTLESALSRYLAEREVDWTEAEHLMAAE